MTASISWTPTADGLIAEVVEEGRIPPSDWALLDLRASSGQRVQIGPLLRSLDDGDARELADGRVVLPSEVAVGLSVQDGYHLGLPPRLDWPLVVRVELTVSEPDATAEFHFEGSRGRPLHVRARTGPVFTVDGEAFRFSPSVFRAIRALDAYNDTKGSPPAARILAWGQVTECLPEDVQADSYLTEIRTCEAEAFTLQPFLNERGEADFDPVPGVWVAHPGEDGDLVTSFEARIPDGPIERFQDFLRRSGPRARSSLGGGWYLSIDRDLLPVLGAFREIQRAEPAVRLDFLRNPETVLRQRLPDVPEEFLAKAFASEDYSERVRGTTIWKPPVLPWVRKDPERWLPEERLGIRIGDGFVAINPEDLSDLIEKLETATESGQPAVDYNGTSIPATEEAMNALRQLPGTSKPEREPRKTDPEQSDHRVRMVLEVAENFEVVSYTQDSRPPPRPGVPELSTDELGLLNNPLPHQVKALVWLQAHWREGSMGALLADDMGLGKTFQTLGFMAWIRREMHAGRVPKRPFLVVAPTGLLENWVDEHESHLAGEGLGDLLRAFGPDLKLLRRSQGSESQAGVALLDLQRIRRAGWVLTTYETYRDYQHSFGKVRFGVAALDETQKAKNPASGISQAMKTIQADFVLCITGTPVENRLADLWNILDVARPGDLGSLKEFSSKFESPEVGETPLKLLTEHLTDSHPSIMLRRMKDDHLDGLPPKVNHFPELEMPPLQCRAYTQILEEVKSGQVREQGGMLAILGRIRSTSLHPFVHSGESDEDYIQASARLILTFRILDEVHSEKDKALIFLESREMQGTLAALIQRRYRTTTRPMIINGSVSGPRRQDRVRRFQEAKGFDALILSPKAGGVGLTLTAANNVIHLSRWWNPAVEDQCTDRVHRIGQDRDVHIHHPLAKHPELRDGSFDHVLHRLLKRKRELSRAVLAPSTLSDEDVAELFDGVLSTSSPARGVSSVDTRGIAAMSPLEFERWVLDRFRKAGYFVRETPRSGDAGVDGIAQPPSEIRAPAVFIQVKHTQVESACPPDGVIELATGHERYPTPQPRELVLVTNSPNFTPRATELAQEHGVRLFALDRLGVIEQAFKLPQ